MISGEDLFDGETYKCFLKAVNNHSRACILYDPPLCATTIRLHSIY
jgi:hypothetical protein